MVSDPNSSAAMEEGGGIGGDRHEVLVCLCLFSLPFSVHAFSLSFASLLQPKGFVKSPVPTGVSRDNGQRGSSPHLVVELLRL